MKIERFEDIEAWKHARSLARAVYEATRSERFARDYGLCNQIQRAAVSIMANIAEGFGRQTDQEFIQFLYIAKGSLSEVQSQLYVALDVGYLDEQEFAELYKQADEIGRLIFGFIRYLKKGRR